MTNRTNELRIRTFRVSPVAKRLAVAAPISVGVGFIRAWFGEHSMLIGLLVAVGSYTFADWLFSTTAEREARIQQIKKFFHEHRMTAAKWGTYILMCSYFFATRSEPSEPAVKQVLSLVEVFGLMAVLVVPVITIKSNSVVVLLSRFMSGLVFYSMALWLVGYSGLGGEDVYRWILTHPNDAANGVGAFVIVWTIVRFIAGSSFESESIVNLAGSAGIAMGIVKPTARDNRYTAAHEAGHALVYAALGGLPADVELTVNDHLDEHGTLGFITDIRSKHHLEEKSFVEWYMLVLLAGKLGESVMLGESTLGSSSDHLRWLSVARNYLANHYRGMYYADPQNKFEQEQNEAKLDALQAEQLATLRILFDTNTEVFVSLTEALLKKRTMGRDDLIPFLSRVKLPSGFTLPFGPFDAFGDRAHNISDWVA